MALRCLILNMNTMDHIKVLHYNHADSLANTPIDTLKSSADLRHSLQEEFKLKGIEYISLTTPGFEFLSSEDLLSITPEIENIIGNYNVFLTHPGIASNFSYVFSWVENNPLLNLGIVVPFLESYTSKFLEEDVENYPFRNRVKIFPGYFNKEKQVSQEVSDWVKKACSR